jgi:hypothetical protein
MFLISKLDKEEEIDILRRIGVAINFFYFITWIV